METKYWKLWTQFLCLMNFRMRPAQASISRKILQFSEITDITWARGTGKSHILGLLAFFFAYFFGWKVIITAPTLQQTWGLMEHVQKAAAKLLKRKDCQYDNRYELNIRGRGSVTCLSGAKVAGVQSHHCHVLFCDEKQDLLPEVISESFIPMLGNYHGIMILSGIGGSPDSVGEVIGSTARFRDYYPYTEYVKIDPRYITTVEQARKSMFPEEFAAHYECSPLDVSSHLLIPRIVPGVAAQGQLKAAVGIDWGEDIDHTVATLAHIEKEGIYIDSWLRPSGPYPSQVKELSKWLDKDIEWDDIYSEKNGVGKVGQFLAENIPAVQLINVSADWITDKARQLHSMSVEGKLQYNKDHPLAPIFEKEMGRLNYKMTSLNHISLPKSGDRAHSDFISSLMLCLQESKFAYI